MFKEISIKTSYDSLIKIKQSFLTNHQTVHVSKTTKPLSYSFHNSFSGFKNYLTSKESQLKIKKDKKLRTKSIPNIHLTVPLFLDCTSTSTSPKNENNSISNNESFLKKKALLISQILKSRQHNFNIVSSFLQSKCALIKTKQYFLIENILQQRINAVMILQNAIRAYLTKLHFKHLCKNDLLFLYNIDYHSSLRGHSTRNSNCCSYDKTAQIKLIIYGKNGKIKTMNFSYSRYLHSYYISFSKKGVMKRKYNVNFSINNNIIIDPRFEVHCDYKNNFYNVIYKDMLVDLKKKRKEVVVKKKKYWEEMFVIKNKRKHSASYDNLSINNNTEMSNETIMNSIFCHTENITTGNDSAIIHNLSTKKIKPILKNNNNNSLINTKPFCDDNQLLTEKIQQQQSQKIIKKVSFCKFVQYSY